MLPPIVFLYGREGSGRTTLANLLSDRLPAAIALSFEEPLRNAMRGTFFGGSPWHEPTTPLPGTNKSPEEFMSHFRDWLELETSSSILGAIALRGVLQNWDIFQYFIFDDASLSHHKSMRRIIDNFKPENCIIIDVQRGNEKVGYAPRSSDVRVETFINDYSTEKEMVDAFIERFCAVRPTAHAEGDAA